jgi:Domain of unknown function DUF1828/Domain of unknown function DUF1829
MLEDIQKLLDRYNAWLKESNNLREIGDWIEITTPYLDRHNDQIQIFARRENGHFVLSDDGYIIRDLESSGCTLATPKRQELLKMTLNGFGVRQNRDELLVTATPENFPLRKHNLIQAMLAVNDLFYLAEPIVKSLFYEDVVAWLDASDVRYTPKVKFTGVSGYDHLFDFVIPKSRQAPERILRAINRPRRDSAEAFLHAWTDTQQVRPPDSLAFAVLNDLGQQVPADVPEAFAAYNITPVLWSQRETVKAQLVA